MTPHDGWTLDALIEGYRQHQRRTRGLRDQTLRGYERLARLLVRVALGDDPIDPTRLNPSDVMAFVASMRGRYSPRSMKTVRAALRSSSSAPRKRSATGCVRPTETKGVVRTA